MVKNFAVIAGLPRTGSTLLCTLLAQHPEIHSEIYSSPLANTLGDIKASVSKDAFFRSQLDAKPQVYNKLIEAARGYIDGWYKDAPEGSLIIDKNRGWLPQIHELLLLKPEARMIVTIRDLEQIWGSIYNQHLKTVLLNPVSISLKKEKEEDRRLNHTEHEEASNYFTTNNIIGHPLRHVMEIINLPQHIQDRIYIIKFEDLTKQPIETLSMLFEWLKVSPYQIRTTNIGQGIYEADSHYNLKYLHKIHNNLSEPKTHFVSADIHHSIYEQFYKFYERYYPEKLERFR